MIAPARTAMATAHGVPAQEMTKWFDTNYHYLVPEFARGQAFALSSLQGRSTNSARPRRSGYHTRPVLLGPVTFLSWARARTAARSAVAARALLPVYVEVLRAARRATAPTGCRSTSPAWCST